MANAANGTTDPANFTEKDYSEENYKLVYSEYKTLIESFKEQSANHGEAPKEAKELKELENEIESLSKTVTEKEKLVHIANARLNELQRLQKASKKYSKKKPERIKTENTKEEESPNLDQGNGEEEKENNEGRAREDEKFIYLGSNRTGHNVQSDLAMDSENPQLIKIVYWWNGSEQKITGVQGHYQLDSGEIKVGHEMGEHNEEQEQRESNVPSDEKIEQVYCSLMNKFICYLKLTTTSKKMIEIGADEIPGESEKQEMSLSSPTTLGILMPTFSGKFKRDGFWMTEFFVVCFWE